MTIIPSKMALNELYPFFLLMPQRGKSTMKNESTYRLSKIQNDLLNQLRPDGCDEEMGSAFNILVARIMFQSENSEHDNGVAISSQTMKKMVGDRRAAPLAQMLAQCGAIRVIPHDRLAGKCRRYRPHGNVRKAFLESSENPSIRIGHAHSVKAGKKKRSRPPELIKSAKKLLDRNVINRPALERVIQHHSTLGLERLQLQELYRLLDRGELDDFGYLTYKPQYEVRNGGRIFELGGMQNQHRFVKHAAWATNPNAYNYDIQKCHPTIALQMLREAGRAGNALEDYLWDGLVLDVAAESGIKESTIKKVVLSLINGAPWQFKKGPSDRMPAIRQFLIDGGHFDEEERFLCLKQHLSLVSRDIAEWRELCRNLVRSIAKPGRGGVYYRNRIGMTLNVSSEHGGAKTNKWYSFILEGYETSFIHHLTTLGLQFGYTPIANEHDGLVTLGAIPEEAIEKAREQSGFTSAHLVLKPFLSETEMPEMTRVLEMRSPLTPAPLCRPHGPVIRYDRVATASRARAATTTSSSKVKQAVSYCKFLRQLSNSKRAWGMDYSQDCL